MRKSFSSTAEAMQSLADDVSSLSDRLLELDCRVEGYKTVLAFLKHVCIRRGVEDPGPWNELVAGYADMMQNKPGTDDERRTFDIMADAAREMLFDEDAPPPSFTVIEGGKPE